MAFITRCALIYVLCYSGGLFAQEFSPDRVIHDVKARGARQVVNEIWASEEKTKIFLGGVSRADPAWVEAAQAVKPGTDAGASEELNDAIALALLKAPYAILPWLTKIWWNSEKEICVFGYDSELPGGVPQYVVRLEQALFKPSPEALRPLRLACLKGIAETKRQLRNVGK